MKVHLDYSLRNATSRAILWTALSTAGGLAGWFADHVTREGNLITFRWGRTETRQAEIIATRIYTYIRMRWVDEPHGIFELRMTYSELTGDYTLEITDTAADDEEADDLRDLWQQSVERLKRAYGF